MQISSRHRFLCLGMAILMLISSVGVFMDMHYCKGELKSVKIYGKAENCHQAIQAKVCPHHQSKSSQQTTKRDCCNNKSIYLQLDTERESPVELELPLLIQQLIASFIYTAHFKDTTPKATSIITSYQPPPPKKDFLTLFQSFLL